MVRFNDLGHRKTLQGQLVWFLLWLFVTVTGLCLHASSALHGTHQQLGLPACPSVALFDRPCFGCGMTTSFTATLHGDFATAFSAHPFGPPLYLLFTVSALASGFGWWKKSRVEPNDRFMNKFMMALVFAFVTFGIVRFATTRYHSEEYAITQAALRIQGR
jgi:hypothetical protein